MVVYLSFITLGQASESSGVLGTMDGHERLQEVIGKQMAEFVVNCTDVMENGGTLEHFFMFQEAPYDSLNQLQEAGLNNERKSLFFCFVLPIIVYINDSYQQNRQIVLTYEKLITSGHELNVVQRQWVDELFANYTHPSDPKDLSTSGKIQILKKRIGVIPVSLAMAQAALESGWGQSRFARHGNALFGEKAAKGEPGIEALNNPRHRVKSFEIVFNSVFSYMRDLNFHPAYKKFRLARQRYRTKGVQVRGEEAIHLLDQYAEDPKYAASITATIRANHLAHFDFVTMTDYGVKIPAPENLKQASL